MVKLIVRKTRVVILAHPLSLVLMVGIWNLLDIPLLNDLNSLFSAHTIVILHVTYNSWYTNKDHAVFK